MEASNKPRRQSVRAHALHSLMPFPQFKAPQYVHWSLSAIHQIKLSDTRCRGGKKPPSITLAKILYRLCHTKYDLPCSSQSFALLGFGVKSGTILHHMSFQAFNTHLLIHKAYLLQCVPPSFQLHHVKTFSFSKHSHVPSRTGKGLTHALPGSTKWIPCCSHGLWTTTQSWAWPQLPHIDLRSLSLIIRGLSNFNPAYTGLE